jgi:hypothetical protein
MSTRAVIAHADTTGRCYGVYLHFDGYPEHTGTILCQRYNSMIKAMELVAGGDLRYISDGNEKAEYYKSGKLPMHFENAQELLAFAKDCDADFLYLFENHRWLYWKMS